MEISAKKSGDVKQIEIEINDEEEDEAAEKQKKDATKKELNDIEAKVQSSNRPNPLKKRDLDGNIVDNSDPSRKPRKDSFDEQLLQWMHGKSGSVTEENTAANITKGKLLLYVTNNNISFDRLLEEAKIHDADEDIVGLLYDMNFEVLIDVYCTRESNYSSKHFKDELKDMGLKSPLIAHKLFNLFEKWRTNVSIRSGSLSSRSNGTPLSASSSINPTPALSFTVKLLTV